MQTYYNVISWWAMHTHTHNDLMISSCFLHTLQCPLCTGSPQTNTDVVAMTMTTHTNSEWCKSLQDFCHSWNRLRPTHTNTSQSFMLKHKHTMSAENIVKAAIFIYTDCSYVFVLLQTYNFLLLWLFTPTFPHRVHRNLMIILINTNTIMNYILCPYE